MSPRSLNHRIVNFLLPFVAAITVWSNASAHEEVFTAILNGSAESPPNASSGTGSVTATLDLDLLTLRLQINFSDLLYPTTAAHIHAPTSQPFTGTADVATQLPSFEGFPLNVTSGTYDHLFDLTSASFYNPAFVNANGSVPFAANAFISALEDGKAYLNIHTSAFPDGEIRGFLVPEPGTVECLIVGAMALLLSCRRRARRNIHSVIASQE